jgi:alpha-galactosidase
MPASPVLVLIGAGSTVFTPGLLHDLAASPAFADAEVRLVDVVPEAAETMAALGRRIAAAAGSRMRVDAVPDRRSALAGAAVVTTTIAVGSAASWHDDLEIPAKHGVLQTVGDSVGPGGVLRALRHVPELLAIARDVADVAPNALLVNYSNPLTANVRAITRQTPVAAIGLCHGTMHTKHMLATTLGVDPERVTATFAGLNHLCWLLDLRTAEEDLYPRLRSLVEERAAGADAPSSRTEDLTGAVSADLMRTFGLYPAPGDRHVAEFFGGYLHPGRGGELAWGLQGGLDRTREYIGEKGRLWDSLRAQAAGTAPLSAPQDQEAERLVAIAAAVTTGTARVELAVNLPNHGLIPQLPAGAVVEVPAVVSAAGVSGVAVHGLPPAVLAVLTARALQQELVVEAAVNGRRSVALQALVLDPLVPDRATATAILDDAVAADPERLGRFASNPPAAGSRAAG